MSAQICRNGHEFAERIYRSGQWACPVCYKERRARGNASRPSRARNAKGCPKCGLVPCLCEEL